MTDNKHTLQLICVFLMVREYDSPESSSLQQSQLWENQGNIYNTDE